MNALTLYRARPYVCGAPAVFQHDVGTIEMAIRQCFGSTIECRSVRDG